MYRRTSADHVYILIWTIQGVFGVNEFLIGNIEANRSFGLEVRSVIEMPPPPSVHHRTSGDIISTHQTFVQAGSANTYCRIPVG
jgi:hypothetical protein